MSDIRFNGWLHRSGTGGVWQDSSGNVGVGSSVPSNPATSANTGIINAGVVTATTYYGSGANLTGIAGTEISNSDFAVGVSTFFVDYETGLVGIGTINPQVRLTVSSDSPAVMDVHHVDGGTNDEARIILGALALNPPSNRGAGIAAVNNGAGHDLIIKCSASHAAGPTEKLRITSAGKVGINEDTPIGDLHITTAGSSQQDGVLHVGGSDATLGLVIDYDQASNTVAKITANPTYTNSSALLKIRVDGDTNADQLVLTGAGNAGINTGSSNFPLKIDCNGASATDAVALHLNNTAGSGRGRAGIVFGSRGGTGAYAAKMFGGPNNDDAGHGDLVFTCANNSGTQNTMLFLHGKSYSDGKIQATPGGGGFQILGALSKSSGSFRIPHPLAGLSTTKDLVHSFIEGPQADLIYRGVSTLSSGTSTVNIDTEARMTDGTFVALADNVSCFTSNETDWKAVKGSVTGNVLTISCEDNTSTAKVSWLVVGERCDAHMISTETAWTDDNGRVITEVDQEPPLS